MTAPRRLALDEQRAARARLASARQTIAHGSKSFAAAAKLLDPAMRADTLLLYAWCRQCDDMIDGQVGGHACDRPRVDTPEARLARLRRASHSALRGDATDPIFAGLGDVVRRNAIPERYVLDHLDGFAMDVEGRAYRSLPDTLDYCYAVAGVVGIMMGHILGVRDRATLIRACDLGIAFQLTNIARDLVEDARMGRVYCPGDWLAESGLPAGEIADAAHRARLAGIAARLIATAEPYYASAAVGIRALPLRAAWAIATASAVYRAIGTEVVRRGAGAWDDRASTSTARKLGLTAGAAMQVCAGRLRPGAGPDNPGLSCGMV